MTGYKVQQTYCVRCPCGHRRGQHDGGLARPRKIRHGSWGKQAGE